MNPIPPAAARRAAGSDAIHQDLVDRSIDIIAGEQHAGGAYPACSAYPVYRFAWLRDGAFVADGMSRHGRSASASGFFDWCAAVVTARRDRIEDVADRLEHGRPVEAGEFLPTRYTLDGRDAAEEWWDFQLDGYGTWLWALAAHAARTGADVREHAQAVRLTTRYLTRTWRLPCYDWWEEHSEHVHGATLAAVAAGLSGALRLGVLGAAEAVECDSALREIRATITGPGSIEGRLRKWLGSTAIDASLLAAVAPFDIVDTATAQRTVAAVERDLVDGGGVHRYLEDVFYGAGRWPVLAAFLGQAQHRLGRAEQARAQLDWIASTADGDGRLPEQVSDRLLAPTRYAEWVERWGPVATPLLWSHGQYLALAADLEVTA